MGNPYLRKAFTWMTAAAIMLSAASLPLPSSGRAMAADAAAPVTADWNATYQTMDGVGASYAYTDSIMMLQLAQAGDQDTVRHLLDLMFSDKNGTGHDIVRVIIGNGGVTSGGASKNSPGFNPVTGLRADADKPGYDVDGNPIPVKGTAGQYGYKIGTWNRIYDGQADSIWPNEPAHPAGTMVPVQDFVWDYDSWNKPVANDEGGPVNWSGANDTPGGNPVTIKDGPRTRKELFDIDQVWTMKQAMQYGVRTFYAAMWEAPYWMSNSSNTPNKIIRGDTTADGTKIYYQAYADYLVNYIKGFWEQWGIPITYINPFNEPDLAGASAAYIREVIDDYIGPTLQKALEPGGALNGIKDPDGKTIDFVPQLAAPEGTNIGATLSRGATVLQELDPDTGKHQYIDVVSTHLYGTVGIGTDETTLKHTASGSNDLALVPYDYTKDSNKWPAYLNGYKIWQTEFMNQDTSDSSAGAYTNRYGNQNINDAVRYAYLMTNMFTSNPGFNGYTWWSAWDSNGADGSDLIRFVHNGAQQNAGHVGTLTGEYRAFKRLYGFGHFSRFMHPGDIRFDVTREPAANLNIVGFKSADNKDFSITITNANNDDSIRPLAFTLKDFPVGTKSVTAFRTSGSENQKKLEAIPVKDGKFVIDIPSASIVTVVPSEGTYATYNGLDGERDIFSTLEAEGNDNLAAGNADGSAGRVNEAVLLGDRDYLAYKNVNFADGSANGGVVRKHLLYLTAQSRAAGAGGSLLAYVLPVGTPVSNTDDILAKGTRVAEILVPGSSGYGKYEAMVDTGDQSAYGHKDLYIVAATGGSGDTITVDRFLFGADDSDWSTAANNSVVKIPGNVLSNGDFDTATAASIGGWSAGRWNIGDLFEQNVTGPTLTADTLQSYSGLSRYLRNRSTSTTAGSAKLSGRISAADRYDGLWQDVTGKLSKGERYRFDGQFLSLKNGPLGYDIAADYPGQVEAALVYYDADGNQLGYAPIGERDMPEPLPARAAGERAWFNGDALVGSILQGGPLNISSFEPVDVRVANWVESGGDPFVYDEPAGTAKVIFALYAKDDNNFYADGLSIAPAPDRDALRNALRAYKGANGGLFGEAKAALTDSGLTQAKVSELMAAMSESPLTILTPAADGALPAGKVGVSYEAALGVEGGTGPYTWSATGLPAGLAVDSAAQAITGTPAAGADTAGTYTVTIAVTDANGASASVTNTLVIEPASPSTEFSATLTGPGNVMPGQSFDVHYGLTNVAQYVYAQDFTVNFDASQLELQDVQSLKAGVDVIGTHETAPGQVRVLAYSQGEGNAVSESGELLRLQFKALPASGSLDSSVYLSDVQVADADGAVTNVSGGPAYRVVIGVAVDKTALNGAIQTALAGLANAEEGALWGQYASGSKAALQAAIGVAQATAYDPSATQEQVDLAAGQLIAAVQAFGASVHTQASVGDLGVMAKGYNKTSASPDWNLYKRYDINNDSRIEITDLAYIARLILNG